MSFARFMSSISGRLARILAGIALILFGLLAVHGTVGTILAVAGLLPLVAGLFNFCLFAPIFGGPLLGKAVH